MPLGIMKPAKPLIFYSVALFIGCITFILFHSSILIGAVFAASFFVIIFTTVNSKFSAIIIGFFILGLLSSFTYYNAKMNSNIIEVRLIKYNEFYSIGQYYGKNILLKGNLKSDYEGINLIIKGKFEHKPDYSKGIIGTFSIQEIKATKADYISNINNFKRRLFDSFSQELGKEKAALLLSICFGDSGYLNEDQKINFRQLGVIHAISVSGFHMAIIYKILEGLLGIWTSMLVSLIYVIFTGSQSATLRSFIMIFILKLSKKVFKNYDGLSSLCLSAIIILTFKPYYCMDLGFMLSYLATLGILLYYKKVRKFLYRLPDNINESISLTLSAQVFSMPYASLILQNISFGFMPGNIILLPIYTVIVVLGNIALIFYKLPIIFQLISKLINFVLLIMDGATYILIKLTPQITYLSIYESLCLLFLILSFLLVKNGFISFKAFPIFILISLLLNCYKFFPNIQYIDLGSSDGVVIQYKNHRVLVTNKGEGIENNISRINNKYRFTNIIYNSESSLNIKLSDNLRLKTLGGSKGAINLQVSYNNKNIIFTQNPKSYSSVNFKTYDIIVLPIKKYYISKSININNMKISSYDMVLNKVYPSFAIGKRSE